MKSGRAQWQKAEETRKDFNIVPIHQDNKFFTSELFKVIQDAISLILHAGQCIDSERFLRENLSHRMCAQFTLHHEFRIGTGKTNFEKETNSTLSACGSSEQRTQRILRQSTWKRRVLHGKSANSVEETSKHWELGRHQTCFEEKIKVLSDAIERHHSSRNTPSLLYPEKSSGWKLKKSYSRKYMRHLVHLQRLPSKIIGWENWIQKLLEVVKTPNKSNQNEKKTIKRTERPVSEQSSGLL